MEYLTYYYRYTILHWLWYNHTRRHLPLLSPWQYQKVAKFLSVVNKAPSMRLIYVVSLSHPTLLYHKNHTYMKGSAWFETFAAIFCFYTFNPLTAYKIIENYRNCKIFTQKVSKTIRKKNRKQKNGKSQKDRKHYLIRSKYTLIYNETLCLSKKQKLVLIGIIEHL